MAKEEDVKDQIVDGQGVEAQVTDEQGVESQVATDVESPADVQQAQDEQQVPYNRFKEVNDAKKVAEEAQQAAEQQLQSTRDQMALLQQTKVEPQKLVSSYEQALIDCSLTDVPYLTPEESIKLNERKDQIDVVKNQRDQQSFANVQFAQSHSDFTKVVGQVNPGTGLFMYSAEVQKILTEKPYLQASCLNAEGAYKVVMQERQLAELSTKSQSLEQHQVQSNVDANLAPMSASAAGGGAVDRKKGGINESSTAEDVLKMEQRVKAGEFE